MAEDTGRERQEERRKFPRLRESCSIRVKPIGGPTSPLDGMDALTVNISGGGVCFRTHERVEAGEFLAVELGMPGFRSPIVAMARAAYTSPDGPPWEVGVEFWWVGWGDDSAQRAISDYIKTELGGRPGHPPAGTED